jgi:hypothetical protein
MSMKDDINKIKQHIKPKQKVKFVYKVSDIKDDDDETNTIWVLCTL